MLFGVYACIILYTVLYLIFCSNSLVASTTPRCRVLTLGHQDPGVFDIKAVANAALAPAPQAVLSPRDANH